ncbi:hypothetical protein SARC_15585, partial [Sphaeroforma arctica JP610]
MRPDQHKQKRSRQYQQQQEKKNGVKSTPTTGKDGNNAKNKSKGSRNKEGPGKVSGSNADRYQDEPEDYSTSCNISYAVFYSKW